MKLTSIQCFSKDDYRIANKSYEQIERLYPNMNTVLVTSTSINELRAAYPNYFSDISQFVVILEEQLKL